MPTQGGRSCLRLGHMQDNNVEGRCISDRINGYFAKVEIEEVEEEMILMDAVSVFGTGAGVGRTGHRGSFGRSGGRGSAGLLHCNRNGPIRAIARPGPAYPG
jgi:hypothetical protein